MDKENIEIVDRVNNLSSAQKSSQIPILSKCSIVQSSSDNTSILWETQTSELLKNCQTGVLTRSKKKLYSHLMNDDMDLSPISLKKIEVNHF